jgi:outer membrane protein OmpA-like peptidoglycan-associated protein
MSEDKSEYESMAGSAAAPKAPAESLQVETRTSKPLPMVPILGVVATILLALWVGLGLRPSSQSPANEDQLRVMKAEVSAMEADLNAQRLALGLRPKENTYDTVEEVAARMKKDADTMVALAQTFQNAIAEKEALLSAKNSEIIQSEQTRQILVGELEKARQQLGNSLAASTMLESLKTENEALKSQRNVISEEVSRLREELAATSGSMPADQVAQWERRLEESNRAREFLESRVEQLDRELAKARLFASSENELLPAALELVRSIRKLENKPDAEIDAEYSRIGVDLGANVLHMLSFETGSAALSAADQERIRSLVADVPDGDLLLCIGYASETGNVDGNRELSSARATAAAELYTQQKRPGQLVQAVYLGQTDRFSSRIPERNQLVEIWRIRKK